MTVEEQLKKALEALKAKKAAKAKAKRKAATEAPQFKGSHRGY